MKNILFALTLAALAVLYPRIASADMQFTKSPQNPLPVETQFDNWTQRGIYQPSVIHDETGYRMWYASAGDTSFAIAYATSTDGTHWSSNNLLTLPVAGSSIYNPFAVPAPDGFTVFFSMDEPGKKARLVSIHQRTDGSYDTGSLADVLSPSADWEANGLFGPFLKTQDNASFLFYSAWGNRGFQIGMATTGDTGMQKCANNPMITDVIADSPHILEKDGVKYLFYHSGVGIRAVSSTDPYSCTMHWSQPLTVLTPGPNDYDKDLMIAPSVLVLNDEVIMYYSGLGSTGWTLNMASTGTPVADAHPATVFVPGLFASWNKNALLYDLPSSPDSWTLNPAVHEYDGILHTFENLGYTTGTDFYVFNYDWRKNIQSITADLNTFMDTVVKPTHPNQVRLLGHSLGGLVARTYMQRYNPSFVNKLVTVGSPHQGAALTYKAAEGGDIEATNNFEWLMQKTVVQVYRDGLKTDKQILHDHLPIIQDLLPIYGPFLTRRDGSKIPLSAMNMKNSTLPQYADTSALSDIARYVAGIGTDTIEGYKVQDRSAYDKLLDLYPDGRPTGTVKGEGDGIVPLRSALAGSSQVTGDHGQIVYRKNDIANILHQLDIPYDSSKIVEGRKTGVSPALVFLVFSPVRLELQHGDKTYSESNGMLFVENAEDGAYTLRAIGTGKGTYKILIGQTFGDSITWNTIEGKITATVPSSQTDTYPLFFSTASPLRNPLNVPGSTNGFDMFLESLKKADADVGHKKLEQALHLAREARSHWGKRNTEPTRVMLFTVMKMLYDMRKKERGANSQKITELISDLESLMIDIFMHPSPGYTLQGATAIHKSLSQRFEQIQNQMLNEVQRKKQVIIPKSEIEQVQHTLDAVGGYVKDSNVKAAEILLHSAQLAISSM